MRPAGVALLAAATIVCVAVLECSRSGGAVQSFPPRLAVLPRTAKVFVGNDLQLLDELRWSRSENQRLAEASESPSSGTASKLR